MDADRLCLQASSRRGSCDMPTSAASLPDKTPASSEKQQTPGAVGVHATAGVATAGPLGKLSLGRGGAHEAAPDHAASGCASSPPCKPSAQQRREQEVEDDDEEEASGAAGALSEHPATATQQPGSPTQGEADELELRVVWDSSSRERGAAASAQPRPGGASSTHGQAAQLKEQGNAHMKAGQLDEAVLRYSQALAACGSAMKATGGSTADSPGTQPQQPGASAIAPGAAGTGADAADCGGAPPSAAEEASLADRRFLATLHSNRAHALLKLKRFKEVSGALGE